MSTKTIAMPGRSFWDLATADGVPKRSAAVALVCGTILNLINQGDVLLAGGHPVVWKLLLTYCVPYCVATYGAVTLARRVGRN